MDQFNDQRLVIISKQVGVTIRIIDRPHNGGANTDFAIRRDKLCTMCVLHMNMKQGAELTRVQITGELVVP